MTARGNKYVRHHINEYNNLGKWKEFSVDIPNVSNIS